MDATSIKHLVVIFSQPRVKRALDEMRAATPIRGDLGIGDEMLMIHQDVGGELLATAIRIEDGDGKRTELNVDLVGSLREAAELLWAIGLANSALTEQIIAPRDLYGFLATQADQTTRELGVRLNEADWDSIDIYPGPLPKS